LSGGDGSDTLDGGRGADTMAGGDGDDFYLIDHSRDITEEAYGAGHDVVSSKATFVLSDNIEDLTLTGNFSADGTGNDLDNRLQGNRARNVLEGLDGDDTIIAGDGVDQLVGGLGDDQLYGGSGDDVLDGSVGIDSLVGGLGDDIYYVDNSWDVVQELVGEGHDTLHSDIDVFLPDHVEDLILAELDSFVLPTFTSAASPFSADIFDGGASPAFGDIDLDGDDDLLVARQDSLFLYENADSVFDSSQSIDLTSEIPSGFVLKTAQLADVNGDSLPDLILSNDHGVVQFLLRDESTPHSLSFLSPIAADFSAAKSSDFNPSFADLNNDGLDEIFYLNDSGTPVYNLNTFASSTLSFAADADLGFTPDSQSFASTSTLDLLDIDGDDDLDFLVHDPASGGETIVFEQLRDASRTVYFSAFSSDFFAPLSIDSSSLVIADLAIDDALDVFVMPQSGPYSHHQITDYELHIVQSEHLHGTGNDLDNYILGNIGDNYLSGADGSDELVAGDGDDSLDGGSGADEMIGGTGDDLYWIDDSADVVVERGNAGFDIAYVNADWELSTGVERVELQGDQDLNLTGTRYAEHLVGNSGDNRLDSAGGLDTLTGGDGDDIYVINNAATVVSEMAGHHSGRDRILSSVSLTLPDHVEELELTSAFARTATGNALDNTLVGTRSANILDGLVGDDEMIGGAGNDLYYVDSASDTTVELSGGGTDHVIASLSWTLSDYVEDLTLSPSAGAVGVELNLDGTGNSLSNQIIGTSGDNRLDDGGGGRDLLRGGDGDDIYIVSTAHVTLTESVNQGLDTVHAAVSFELGSNFEHLVLKGPNALSGLGNSLDNTLTGNDLDNELDGGRGADVLIGGAGDDSYVVDNVSDSIVELASEGVDSVKSSVTYTLDANVENLELTGMHRLSAYGNALANHLVGNSGDNILDGQGGADLMEGGVGDDTYFVDHPDDVVSDILGNDHVNASIDWTLSAGLDDLTLLGNAVTAIGNDSANELVGTSLDNILDGQGGNDILTGGLGADVFVLRSPGRGNKADVITDFNSVDGDRVALPAYMFGANALPDIETVTSFTGLLASLKTDTDLVYNSRNGRLYYNGNGSSHGLGSDGGLLGVFSDKPAVMDSFIALPDPLQGNLTADSLAPLLWESPLQIPSDPTAVV